MINFSVIFPVEKCFRKINNFSMGKMAWDNRDAIVHEHFSHRKIKYFSKTFFYRKSQKSVLFFQDFSTKKLFYFPLGKMHWKHMTCFHTDFSQGKICGHLECKYHSNILPKVSTKTAGFLIWPMEVFSKYFLIASSEADSFGPFWTDRSRLRKWRRPPVRTLFW